MIDLIRAEWIKFRSVRSTVVTLCLAGALGVLVAVIAAHHQNSEHLTTHLSDVTAGVSLSTLIFGALGVQVIGQEYRFTTIRPTFTAAPHRIRVIIAKVIVASAACGVVAAIMVAGCWAIGAVYANSFSLAGDDHRIAWGIVLFTVLWTAAGVGIGAIVRQPVAGILAMILWSVVAEGLIGSLIQATNRWLPFANGFQMTQPVETTTDRLSVLGGGVYFAVVCVALVAIGALLADKRDA